MEGDELLAGLDVARGHEFLGTGGGEFGDGHGALFEVKLQAHHAVAVDERLLCAGFAFRHAARAGWEGEGVAVPVHHGKVLWKRDEGRTAVENADGPPADFLLGVLEDFSAEHVGEAIQYRTLDRNLWA